MFSLRKPLVLCATSFFFIGHGIFKASAENLPLPDAFQKCDQLLGKPPKAVLDALGQPDEASPVGDRTQPEHILGWGYKDKAGHTLSLLFSPTKGLMVVTYNGLIPKGTAPDQNNITYLLPSYDPATLKVGYEGQVETNLYAVLIRAKTPSGNLFRIGAQVNSTSPSVKNHLFNAAKGIYIDSLSPNPNLMISSFVGLTPAVLVSPRLLSGTNPEKLPPRWQALSFQATGGNSYWPDHISYIPLTRKIAPCLQQK